MPGDEQGDQLVADQAVGVLGPLGGRVEQHVEQSRAVGSGGAGAGGLDGAPGDRVDPGEIGGDGPPGVDAIGGQGRQGGHHGGDGVQFVFRRGVEGVAGQRAPDGVQGEAAHLPADVEPLAGAGVPVPALRGDPGGPGDALLVAAHPGAGELGLEQPPLPLPGLAGGGEDPVADQQAGPVGALDVPLRPQGEHVPDRPGVGDQDGRVRAEAERGDAAEPFARQGEQVDELGPVRAPALDVGRVQLGDRAAAGGRGLRERARAGFGGHGSPPVRPLSRAVSARSPTGRRHHGLYGTRAVP